MVTYHETDEIVMVPVPRSRLGAVYSVLASPPMDTTPEASEETIEVNGQGPWTAVMMRQLDADLDIPAIRALINLVAERAPKPLTFEEAVHATGVEAKLLRAQVGSLTKATKRLFGARTWPMSVRYGEAGEAIYSMDPRVAGWWCSAAGGQPTGEGMLITDRRPS